VIRLTSEAANKIFQHAKERVYTIIKLSSLARTKLTQKAALPSATSSEQSLHEMLSALNLEHVIEPVLGKHIKHFFIM